MFIPCLISLFSQIDDALMMKFDSLINLDLRRNNISALEIFVGTLSIFSVLVRVCASTLSKKKFSFVAFITCKPTKQENKNSVQFWHVAITTQMVVVDFN